MLNIEKYKDELNKDLDTLDCQICTLRKNGNCNCGDCSDTCRAENIKWLCSEYKEFILTEEERKYLSAVIEPFKKYVMYIAKLDFKVGWEKIVFYSQSFKTWECMTDLPPFQSGTRFKGMELNEHYYKLEELGL